MRLLGTPGDGQPRRPRMERALCLHDGEAATLQQWGLYLVSSLALAALLWALAVWRYKQEKLAISA